MVLAGAPASRPSVTSCAAVYRRRRVTALLALVLLVAAAVVGLALLRAAAVDDGVPNSTAVVEVQPGETLWDLATRVAPDSPTPAVVDRIRELNGMRGSTLYPGLPLVVPSDS
ncbi:MAG TPA: LysM peptidoglycan-binding domain-containing protein [Pseudonocardiaceae bacterium]